MRVGQIDVPEPLLEAQRNGTLVVFAGAGLSMPPPSDYPRFERLAQQIAEGYALAREENEPPDRFLGRLQNGGALHENLNTMLLFCASRIPAQKPASATIESREGPAQKAGAEKMPGNVGEPR